MADLLSVGEKAPEFETTDQNGNKVTLGKFRGMPVVLYFYPKDDTPGCTTEACSFRDNHDIYRKHGVEVLGVSVDGEESHKKFVDKFNLNFTLLADSNKEIVIKYGVIQDNGHAKRVTYLIDQDGKIAHVYEKVTPKEHAETVLSKLRELGLVSE